MLMSRKGFSTLWFYKAALYQVPCIYKNKNKQDKKNNMSPSKSSSYE